MVPEVEDSVAVGLRGDGDVEVVLFVKLALTEDGAPTSSGDGGGRPRVRGEEARLLFSVKVTTKGGRREGGGRKEPLREEC